LRWGFAAALFINATQIVQAALRWEGTRASVFDVLYWVAASYLMYGYFVRYDPSDEYITVFDVSVPRSWPSWAFLGGWILARLNVNDFNAWAEGIVHLSQSLGRPLNWDAALFPPLPTTPLLLKFVGGLAVALGGLLLLFDAITAYRERRYETTEL
jgi:hypothetical protein